MSGPGFEGVRGGVEPEGVGPSGVDGPPVTPGSRLHEALIMEELVRANVESNQTMQALVEKVRQDAEMRNRKVDLLEAGQRETRRLLILVVAAIGLILMIAVFNFFNVSATRRAAAQSASAAKDARNTNALLLDCLNPRGVCGQQNAAQQKRAVDEIKKYELTILYCARINPQPVDKSGERYLACVKRLYPSTPSLNGR